MLKPEQRNSMFRKYLLKITEGFGGLVLEYRDLHLITIFPGG